MTPAELESAFNERTAMAYILAGPQDDGPLGTKVVAEARKRHNVPLVVDAAAEILTLKPNVHLARGATVVAYSGGKCIRGPQAAGLLLGEKKLLQAAWINSAPHHAFGRSLKVGKEEIMGMLAAVEMWVKRDHKAEWAMWESWLNQIATSVKRVDGVTTQIRQPSRRPFQSHAGAASCSGMRRSSGSRGRTSSSCCSRPSRASTWRARRRIRLSRSALPDAGGR